MSLDDELAAWAASVRMTDADAEAIFQHIVLRGAVVPTAAPAPQAPREPVRKAERKAERPRPVTVFPAAASVAVRSASGGPTGLAPSWWRDYTKDFAARMVTATRPVLVAA